jgi:hypothetical protein
MKKTSTAPRRIDTTPAKYAQSSPCRNAVLAPAMIASAYCGCCCATASALSNDFVSSACVLSVMSFPEAPICEETAVA